MTREQGNVDPIELTRAVWQGKGAEAIGIQGEVCKVDFGSVFNAGERIKG